MAMFQHILCPIDFSACSAHALRYAVALAERFGAEVMVVHAFPVPTYHFMDGAFTTPPQVVAAQSARLEKELNDFVQSHGRAQVNIRHQLLVGAPQEAIVSALEGGKYDLVVMGTHGRTGLRRAWLGSIAERIVRTATQPVLTVPLHEATSA